MDSTGLPPTVTSELNKSGAGEGVMFLVDGVAPSQGQWEVWDGDY